MLIYFITMVKHQLGCCDNTTSGKQLFTIKWKTLHNPLPSPPNSYSTTFQWKEILPQ